MSLVQQIPEAHEMWLAALRASGRRKTTTDTYQYAIGQLVEWRGNADLTTLSKFEALRFTAHLNEHYQPGGVASRLKTLRGFYSWCITEELVTVNPFRTITVKVPDDPQPTASEDDIDKMLTSAKRNKRDHALIVLLVDSGMRKDECAHITMADVDLRSGTVTIRVSKSRPRTVPLSDRAVVAIGKWLRQRGVGSGSLWSVGDPYSLVRAAVRRHSGGGITPHQLRRSFAIRWLLAGGSETSLMRLCGWSSREMITLYSRASADVVADTEFRRLLG